MMNQHAIDPFEPDEVVFYPVSKKLIIIRYIVSLPLPLVALVVLGVDVIPMQIVVWWFLICAVLFLLLWLLWIIPRQVRFMAWGRTATDLYIRSGRMFRSLTCTPFGRIQFVDVSRGPLERLFGLASVSIHTASAVADKSIPGLTPMEAAILRREFAQAAREELAGI
ncbi:MAG: DUF2101 family protein [Actinomycetaceae bacterium]|nr:DUF2101 family protein [Actinomycetaceae bacterium]MDO5747017.1 DUF2101 family protein [Actinomycetaceae bacterium]